jgi:uncharacterized protein (TIGR00369 family)
MSLTVSGEVQAIWRDLSVIGHDAAMTILEQLRQLPRPVCAELTPFEVLDADESGTVQLRFGPQPAFGNHFGNVQGGFCVALLDVALSLAAYAATGRLCPTVEISTRFLAPTPLDGCLGEGTVLRAGTSVVICQAVLMTPDGVTTAHGTATALRPA